MTKSFLPPPEAFATYPAPNYIDPQTRGKATCITAIVCGVLSIFFVSLRLIARLRIKRGLGWDDFWILFGLIFGICFYINIILGTQLWGYKYHIWDLPPRLYKGAAIIEITAVLFFLLSTSGIRMSLLSFYLHLVRDAGSVGWKRTIHGFVVVTIVLSLAFGLTAVFRCTPVSAYWTYPMPEDAKCFDDSIITLVGGVLVVVADLCTMLLPLPVVLSFNMPIRQRISVAVLLSLGIVVTIVSTTRTVYLWKSLIGTYDITWESHPLLICGSVEIVLSIVCACLPSIKPLYEKFCNWLSHHRHGFRSFFDNSSSDGTTAVGSKRQFSSKKPSSLSLDMSNASFSKGTIHAMYPLSTFTSINGKMGRVSEEEGEEMPETPMSWVSESGKGSSGSWLSGGLTPTSVNMPSPTKKDKLQVDSHEAYSARGSEDDNGTGITVKKSVDIEYSEA
ncbi:hypothetical protein D6D21_05622 [Aureobasidium pullulans]|uniref:Rhodopsin domain-containing protein n=1 Tax=Aureobasidium pullulans TaxID=5580 RepID=A0AB74IXE5_AURPU|nr:hypothetical protein D6D21_05622 [Aureobasidium pullulans]